MKIFMAAVAGSILLSSPVAATTPNSYITPQVPNRGVVQFLQGVDSPGVAKTLYLSPAAGTGSRCYGGWITSTNSGSIPAYVRYNSAGLDFGGVATYVGSAAGVTPGAPAVDWMSTTLWPGLPTDEYGNRYIQLNAGDSLKGVYTGTLSAGAAINFLAMCSDY